MGNDAKIAIMFVSYVGHGSADGGARRENEMER
jgi:hypothetical protein